MWSHPELRRFWQVMAAEGRRVSVLQQCDPCQVAHGPVDIPTAMHIETALIIVSFSRLRKGKMRA